MNGRLRLRIGCEDGRSVVRDCRCDFPLVALRPQREADWLRFIVLTPSGGLLDGDELEAEVVVEAGAKLELRTQAATQLHAGRSSQIWRMSAGEDACLGCLPQPLAPHAGAKHSSRVVVDLAPTASLFLAETVTPGRAHRGERFAYEELRLDVDVWRAGSLVARERQLIHPGSGTLKAQLGPYEYFASACLFGREELAGRDLRAGPTVDMGMTPLAFGGLCARLLGRRAFDLAQPLQQLLRNWQNLPSLPARPTPCPAPEAGLAATADSSCRKAPFR